MEPHRFAPELLADVRASSRSDNWHGPMEAAEHWTAIAGSVFVSLWGWRHLPPAIAGTLYALVVVAIGGRQRALAGLLHQASHHSLMRNRRAGAVLGTVLGGYPVLQSLSGYRATHVFAHHARLGDPVHDPDYLQYQRCGLCGPTLGRAALRRHLLHVFGPRLTFSYAAYLVRERILATDEHLSERWLRLPLTFAAVIAVVVVGSPSMLVMYWFLPLVTAHVWCTAMAELLEHYPLIEVGPGTALGSSWNRRVGVPSRVVLGEQRGEGYHLVHHLFPHVPIWRLKGVDAILRRDPVYAAVPCLGAATAGIHTIYRSLPEARLATRVPA